MVIGIWAFALSSKMPHPIVLIRRVISLGVFPKIGVKPPKSSILIVFSIINHPFWEFSHPYFWKHPYSPTSKPHPILGQSRWYPCWLIPSQHQSWIWIKVFHGPNGTVGCGFFGEMVHISRKPSSRRILRYPIYWHAKSPSKKKGHLRGTTWWYQVPKNSANFSPEDSMCQLLTWCSLRLYWCLWWCGEGRWRGRGWWRGLFVSPCLADLFVWLGSL